MKSRQRKNAQTAATVLSVNAKTSRMDDYNTAGTGCQGVHPRMVGIGFTLLLIAAALTDNGTLPLWGTVLAGVVGLALLWGGVRNAV